MLAEKKIRTMIEDELLWLEKFAAEPTTNIYRITMMEADRKIVRMSALYEVLEEAPDDDAIKIVKIIKEKLENK